MTNTKADVLLVASVRWMSGGLSALEAAEVFSDVTAVARALESSARCFRKAAELMDEAARELRTGEKS